MSSSTAQPGIRARISRTTAAKIAAPPSFWSSRFTDVMTAWRNPMRATASATRRGSSGSGGSPGRPVFTAQNPHARVQTSPRTMNVAVPRFQHSPTFGQRASSQTVCRSSSRMRPRNRSYPEPRGARARIHSGRGRSGTGTEAVMRDGG
jgi:hypothetical protein